MIDERVPRTAPIGRAIAVACGLTLAGCATNPKGPDSTLGQQFRNTFASEDPCSNNARNLGVVGGVVVGSLIGHALGDGKAGAIVGGGLAGGLIGGLIGSDLDRKRCELSKVAKKYELEIRFAPIASNGDVLAAEPAKKGAVSSKDLTEPVIVGTSLTVQDRSSGAGHFETASDQLTPKAQEYFAAIAAQYTLAGMLEGKTEPKERQQIIKQASKRRLFLIGHTDDTGVSQLNANLSEKRARSVAAYLREKGLSEESLYFQGAGETQPVADNRSEAGRALNRRVELVEVADEQAFEQYLAARKPNYQFYRPQTPEKMANPSAPAVAGSVKPAPAPALAATVTPAKTQPPVKPPGKEDRKVAAKVSAAAATSALAQSAAKPKPILLNFGGQPYKQSEASLNVTSIAPTKTGFSWISTAQATDSVALSDCTLDRPRVAGSVRSLKDGKGYKTNEHLPQLYGKTWAAEVNGHLLVINHLAVLKDGGQPANFPELKVYGQYSAASQKPPDVSEETPVNTYLTNQGLLYRMFPRGDGGLRCMDILFGNDGAPNARAGKIIYGELADRYVANFKPKLQ